MQIHWQPEPEAHPLWPDVLRLLQPAADLGGMKVYEPGDWVWFITENGTLHGAATTRLCEDRTAELMLAAGHRFREWVPLVDGTISQWARDGGARRLTMRGRVGWDRFAKRFGWDFLGHDEDGRAMFEKEL